MMPNKYKPTEQELELAQDAVDIKRANDIIQEEVAKIDMSQFDNVADVQNYLTAQLATMYVQLEKEFNKLFKAHNKQSRTK